MINIYKELPLYEYQKKVVDKAMEHDKYFLILEPGLGKTLTSLSIAQEKKYKNILVICQKSKLNDWALDIEKYLGIKTHILRGNKVKDNKVIDNFNNGAIISSYGTIWRRDINIDESFIIIIDESQYLKGRKTSIGKWGASVSEKVKDLLLLSGTPLNKPEDLFNQMKMLGMKLSWKEFAEMFLIEELQKFPGARFSVKVIKGYKNQEILNKSLSTQSYSLKTGDAIDLPKQNFIDIKLRHDRKKVYDSILKHKAYKDLEIPSDGVLFMRLRQMSSGYIENYKDISNHKKDALRDLLESDTNNFVVFYNFVQELNDIKEIAKELDIKVFEFNGETKNGYDSRDCNDRFIIACQYQSAAEGINLQHLQHQLYYSPPVSFMKYKQSLARIHRVGQDKPVFYYRFRTIGTVETKIYRNLELGKDYDEKVFKKERK